VLLSGDTGSTVLSGALTSLSKDGDTFLRSRETAY
jgi:hypothetical protein